MSGKGSGAPSKLAACIALAVSVYAGLITPVRASTPVAGRLGVGQHVFWTGPYVSRGDVPDSDLCGSAGPCWTWTLVLGRGGHRLRVAIDVAARDDPFGLELIDPSGALAASGENDNTFNAELFVDAPKAGKWQVRVRPTGATATHFRMRAKLEGRAPKPSGRAGMLLPDLRSVPPYEFTFAAPANPFNGLYPGDNMNPPLEAAGVHPFSCAFDEAVEDGVSRCLRFTAGPVNMGSGPFEIHFAFVDDTTGGGERVAYQTVYRIDGSYKLRKAGSYSFHTTHMHFHYEGILGYEVYRVLDLKRGRIAKVGPGHKSGFCPADQLIGEWSRFVQAGADTYGEGDSASGNCFSPTDGLIGLSVGWGDVYRWQRPGQYVDFGAGGDGYYVVRGIVDTGNDVLESNERNNVSYALILVAGDSVDIVERGLGRDPWDRSKRVVPSIGGPLR
jgi:hypothetical protein